MSRQLKAKLQHHLRRWKELSARERRTLLQATALLPVARTAVKLLSISELRRVLGRELRPSQTNAAGARARTEEVVRMVAIAADRGPMRANCLVRAVTACLLLRRLGIPVSLCLGGARQEGKFAAHAWIECEGEKFDVTRPAQPEYLAFDAPLAAPRARR